MPRHAPLPPYIKDQGGGGVRPGGGAPRGSPTPTGSTTPPFPCWSRREGKRGRGGRKRGLHPLSNSDQRGGGCGRRPPSFWPLSSILVWPNKAHILPANSRNSPVLQKIPESLETFPMSEYSHPIYRSLRLDHFETPRHVPDLIRDSERLRYIKTHKLII